MNREVGRFRQEQLISRFGKSSCKSRRSVQILFCLVGRCVIFQLAQNHKDEKSKHFFSHDRNERISKKTSRFVSYLAIL